jgi:hypothetical protein
MESMVSMEVSYSGPLSMPLPVTESSLSCQAVGHRIIEVHPAVVISLDTYVRVADEFCVRERTQAPLQAVARNHA